MVFTSFTMIGAYLFSGGQRALTTLSAKVFMSPRKGAEESVISIFSGGVLLSVGVSSV